MTNTTREGAGVPGLLEMSKLLRARGVDVCNWAEQAVAEAAWKAAKADELAFLEGLYCARRFLKQDVEQTIHGRIAELRATTPEEHERSKLKGESRE